MSPLLRRRSRLLPGAASPVALAAAVVAGIFASRAPWRGSVAADVPPILLQRSPDTWRIALDATWQGPTPAPVAYEFERDLADPASGDSFRRVGSVFADFRSYGEPPGTTVSFVEDGTLIPGMTYRYRAFGLTSDGGGGWVRAGGSDVVALTVPMPGVPSLAEAELRVAGSRESGPTVVLTGDLPFEDAKDEGAVLRPELGFWNLEFERQTDAGAFARIGEARPANHALAAVVYGVGYQIIDREVSSGHTYAYRCRGVLRGPFGVASLATGWSSPVPVDYETLELEISSTSFKQTIVSYIVEIEGVLRSSTGDPGSPAWTRSPLRIAWGGTVLLEEAVQSGTWSGGPRLSYRDRESGGKWTFSVDPSTGAFRLKMWTLGSAADPRGLPVRVDLGDEGATWTPP